MVQELLIPCLCIRRGDVWQVAHTGLDWIGGSLRVKEVKVKSILFYKHVIGINI